ncbi:ABC transporter ATP-binding protein [Microbacterium sp. Marseille-Q6965]|uniref:ABC transporter ATP-binding protein n=1 Tax=Microbacterium sp. Marseille-Q6965 TaxID=2965072 RepID=UPI0021B74477|nr:ABC transporter ATP-binding protein [Microbacterium sp. Marseille-Q6965]
MTLLDITDLTIEIGGRRLVDGVSFAVAPGERVGLIGESGSGKSLTCFALTGLLPPTAVVTGSIVFEGENLVGADERRLSAIRGQRVGMVFQEPATALDPLQPVGRQMVSGMAARRRLSRTDRLREARRLAVEVGLPEPESIVHRYPHELSGGQRQRVVIAGAMATAPSLVVADEPTTALDVTVQARVLRLLEERCAAAHSGLLLVTHDMAVAMQSCDRIVVMRRGRVIEEGTPSRLIASPTDPYTAMLIDAAYETSWQPTQDEPVGVAA